MNVNAIRTAKRRQDKTEFPLCAVFDFPDRRWAFSNQLAVLSIRLTVALSGELRFDTPVGSYYNRLDRPACLPL